MKKIVEPLIEEVAKRTSKRKRKPTACIDKKRTYHTCGICGSKNLIECGVQYCDRCGAEEHYVIEDTWFFLSRVKLDDCKCHTEHHRYYYYHTHLKNVFCVDCDAIEGPLCPNCKRKCWAKGNRRFCKHCGFRRD